MDVHVVSAFRRTIHVVSAFRRTNPRSVRLQADHHVVSRTSGPSIALTHVMLPRRPERLNSFDYLGLHAYFLTYCTDQRHEAFVEADCVEVVSTQILRAAADEQFALVAYCYMPDHLHLLINGEQENSDCRAFIKRSKQFSGFYYQKPSAVVCGSDTVTSTCCAVMKRC